MKTDSKDLFAEDSTPDFAEWGLSPGDIILATRQGRNHAQRCNILMRRFAVDYETAVVWLKKANGG